MPWTKTNGNTAHNEPGKSARASQSLRALIANLVDYAGLFPPADLGMPDAVVSYASYLDGETTWALGRFVVPASKLQEFELALQRIAPRKSWRLSCVMGNNPRAELEEIARFNDRNGANGVLVDTVEVNLQTADMLRSLAQMIPGEMTAYFEVRPGASAELLAMIQAAEARAKIRTGGVNPDAIPATASIAGFLARCAAAGTAFKATAGLHHPLRCMKPLTYDADAPSARMHGFLNVFLAAVFARQGAPERELAAAMDADEAAEFRFDDTEACWGDSVVTTQQIREARERFAISFGSCSFEEPIGDLRQLQLL